MYHLVTMISGKQAIFPLPAGSNRVGRGGANEIVITNPHVSREHAIIVVGDDRVTINDLNSSHGTWVNGAQITGYTRLRPGDTIRLGDLDFVLRDKFVDAEETPTPGGRTESAATTVRLSAPEDVRSSTQLDAADVRGGAIQSPTVAFAMMAALTEAGNLLTGNQPLGEVFDHVLELVAQVIPANRILLLTVDSPTGEPVVRATRPSRTGEGGDPLVLSRTIAATVLEGRKALLLNDLPHDSRFMLSRSIDMQKLRSALVAPLFDNTDVIGLLYADDNRPFTYDSDHLRAFTVLANLIAIKITNTRLHEAEQTMVRLEEEMATAGHIQRSMLSASLPDVTGYSMTALTEPCQEVGGDLYDLARLNDGRIAVVIGDVSGKGIGAALLMSNVMACLRMLYQDERLDSCYVADRLHRELLESAEPGYFVTLFFGILDSVSHKLDYVNAGHNPPLLICGDAKPRLLTATGVPLGLVAGVRYETASVDIPPDSLLCLFSDGIPEAWTGTEFYGDERFEANLRFLRSRPLEEISAGVLRDVRAFLGGTPASDDITLCLLRREAETGII